MELDAYIAEVVDRHRRTIWESGEHNVTKAHKDIVDKCIRYEGVLDTSMRLWLPGCLEAFDDNLSEAWKLILQEALDSKITTSDQGKLNPYSFTAKLEEASGGNAPETVRLVSRVWTLSLYSLFLRRFRVLASNRFTPGSFSFDLIESVRRLLATLSLNSKERDRVEWLVSNYCCYAALSVYPLLIWYSTTFGTELPPGTIRSYQPTIMRRDQQLPGEPVFTPMLRTKLSDYGWRDQSVLDRNSRMLEIDSTLMAMAIDIFYGRFLTNPWIRSSVLSSFINTIVSQANNKRQDIDYVVLPVIIPKEMIHPQSEFIPVPLVLKREISPRVLGDMRDLMQRLSQQALNEELMLETTNLLIETVRNEILRDESNVSRRLEPVVHSLDDSPCVDSIIVESMHPIAGYYLIRSVAGRSMAYIPSPALTVNVMHLLMNRLLQADYIETYIYLVIRVCPLIRDYQNIINHQNTIQPISSSDFKRARHVVYYRTNNNKMIKMYSINIERIAKALLIQQEKKFSNKYKYKCINNINDINKNIVELVW